VPPDKHIERLAISGQRRVDQRGILELVPVLD
jgi:hypothetical protein